MSQYVEDNNTSERFDILKWMGADRVIVRNQNDRHDVRVLAKIKDGWGHWLMRVLLGGKRDADQSE